MYHELLKEIVFVWFFVGILLGGGTPSSDINLSSQWAKHWGLLSPQFLAELFRGMLFKWKGANSKSHQK